MACFQIIKGVFFLCSYILFEEPGGRDYIKSWNCFYRTIKAIPLKVFGRWGAGKITFFQKGVFPARPFCNSPLLFICDYLNTEYCIPAIFFCNALISMLRVEPESIAARQAHPTASPIAMQLALMREDECATWSTEIGRPAI